MRAAKQFSKSAPEANNRFRLAFFVLGLGDNKQEDIVLVVVVVERPAVYFDIVARNVSQSVAQASFLSNRG